MSNNLPDYDFFDDEEEIDIDELFEEYNNTEPCSDDDTSDSDTPDDWNLITAFNTVLLASQRQKGQLMPGRKNKSAMEYLKGELQMTQMQIIVIAMLIDSGHPLSWANMAHYLDVTRLTMMTYTDDVEELVDKRRWLINKAAREYGKRFEGFALVPGVIRALRHNTVFVPENITNLDEQTFVDRMVARINDCARESDMTFADTERWLDNYVSENMHLPLCQAFKNLEGDLHNQCLLLLFVADYARYGGSSKEGLTIQTISSFFPGDMDCQCLRMNLCDQTHELFRKGYIENCCDDGIADTETFVLTQKAKDELLPSYRLHTGKRSDKANDRDLLHHTKIAAKQLYYNTHEGSQVERLKQILSQEQFSDIQQRLADKGMRTGVAVLLSGGPGTGKTETVRQIARETGRDLLMIDISQVKDKFVGESEKNTKAIFERYNRLCRTADVKPILFINECDAILGKRMENTEHSVDKMQNSMQNILLQALEDLDGVIICTTNLAQSLDSAFERRFLMKIEFSNPDTEVRAHIWQSMIPSLTDKEALSLAERYNFSGGQCENVMRKATIEEIINGTTPTFSQLDAFCKEESVLQKKRLRPIIGFAA